MFSDMAGTGKDCRDDRLHVKGDLSEKEITGRHKTDGTAVQIMVPGGSVRVLEFILVTQ